MQMNCKFAIFMLVNICMSLFTTDVAGAVKSGREKMRNSNCEDDYEVLYIFKYFNDKKKILKN